MTNELEIDLDGKIAELEEIARTAHRERPGVQEAFPDPDGAGLWMWLQRDGWRIDPRVRALSVAVPPREVWQFANIGDDWGFVVCGTAAYGLVLDAVARCGVSMADLGAVLDFGCGPGRTLRVMLRHARDVRFVGTDVDATAIAWCRAHFPFGEFRVNAQSPPTDLPDSTFGLVYAISVFSHLAEAPARDWLRELRRTARSDGILLVTVHGRRTLDRATTDEAARAALQIGPDDVAAAREAFERIGFAFVRQTEGHLDRDRYGIAFVSEDYVRREWGREFEVVAHIGGALDDWQDAVVLRRRD